MNQKKIFNDPVYGFVAIPFKIIHQIIEHPLFQRLRRIKQLGLTHYVYPGALHNRFQHALGAVHLMTLVLEILRGKGLKVSREEEEAVLIAMLLHDIGHGPFSHALENSLVQDVTHEELSLALMNQLNTEFEGRLSMGIEIFEDKYSNKFFHQLISSQLDVDRLDYLNRDSFFTGVHEGVIGYDRIIKLLTVHNDELVVEAKGIYSIEKFIIARRLMYWQVYLHKTVLVAEQMLVKVLQRAKELAGRGEALFTTPPLHGFLYNNVTKNRFNSGSDFMNHFSILDDFDIFTSLKMWVTHKDLVLSKLCESLVNRRLFKIRLQNDPIEKEELELCKEKVIQKFGINSDEAEYLVFCDSTSNSAYSREGNKINILHKNGTLEDIASASDQLNISVLSEPVIKYYCGYPKDI